MKNKKSNSINILIEQFLNDLESGELENNKLTSDNVELDPWTEQAVNGGLDMSTIEQAKQDGMKIEKLPEKSDEILHSILMLPISSSQRKILDYELQRRKNIIENKIQEGDMKKLNRKALQNILLKEFGDMVGFEDAEEIPSSSPMSSFEFDEEDAFDVDEDQSDLQQTVIDLRNDIEMLRTQIEDMQSQIHESRKRRRKIR
tara:strand:+ start:62 stop:667 length:606 start_codon:yes stop_codon:yes gene_type:complete